MGRSSTPVRRPGRAVEPPASAAVEAVVEGEAVVQVEAVMQVEAVVEGEALEAVVNRAAAGSTVQTLHRGLCVLEALAEAERALPGTDVAAALHVHRSIAYRLLRTLEGHRLVTRTPDGCWQLGIGLVALARGVAPTLQGVATPELAELADALGMTAFLAVADREQCLTVLTVEPRHSRVHVVYRPGRRHPLDRGGPGIALLAGHDPRPGERAEVTAARRAGYTVTHGEVIASLSSVAAPVGRPALASVAVLFPREHAGGSEDDGDAASAGLAHVVDRVCAAAAAIARELA